MTLPANDVFTLGLAHNTSSTRSRSPRISFSSRSKSPPFSASFEGKFLKGGANRKQGDHQISHRRSINKILQERPQRAMNGAPPRPSPKHERQTPARHAIDWEIPRKTLHSSIGFFTIYLYMSHGSPRLVVTFLCTALAVIVPADILRLRSPRFERIYERWLGFLMRESEKKSSNGVIWYLIGAVFCLAVYPLDIAVVAILTLSWADTAASTFGRMFGSLTPPLPRRLPLLRLPFAQRKSLAGFIAACVTGASIAIGFWKYLAPSRNEGLSWHWDGGAAPTVGPVAEYFKAGLTELGVGSIPSGGWLGLGVLGVFAGLVAGIAEALDLGSLDDNLTLPIISGGCLWGFLKLLGLFSS